MVEFLQLVWCLFKELCFVSCPRAQQEVCCSVLERLLSALSASLILENLHHEIVRWLQHGSEPVQSLCLSQVPIAGGSL